MHKVIIYSTPSCVYCKKAKEYFAQNSVAYEEHDVASDTKAREEMLEESQQLGVPVIDIDGSIIVGFDKKNIDMALGLAK
jgi:glutaredoxin-like YruB-family protein